MIFENLKTKNRNTSKFKSMKNPTNFSRSPGTSTSDIKGNEAERKIRCQHCGWICDRDRDSKFKDGSWAGYGIDQGVHKYAGSAAGDGGFWGGYGIVNLPYYGYGLGPFGIEYGKAPDIYHDRTIVGGCPCCGSYLYDEKESPKKNIFHDIL